MVRYFRSLHCFEQTILTKCNAIITVTNGPNDIISFLQFIKLQSVFDDMGMRRIWIFKLHVLVFHSFLGLL